MVENAIGLATQRPSSVKGEETPAAAHDPKNDRELLINSYERDMAEASRAARAVGSLYALSRFLEICSLTWATVVLLGAFVSNLTHYDFALVTALLVLEAARLASAAFFSQLVTTPLAFLSQNPESLHHDEDDQYKRAWRARLISQIFQFLLISPSIVLPAHRLPFVQLYYGTQLHPTVKNLQSALNIFYFLVLINAAVSYLALICSAIAFIRLSRPPIEQSIHRYHDEILKRTFSYGIVQADDFGFFEFAYSMLGREYARNVQPKMVVKHHPKLMKYLYAHRQGLDFLLNYLDDRNAFVQQAAANMVGFWSDPTCKLDLPELKLPANLLTKLADKLGTGQVGWAAANSFAGLARRDPELVLQTVTSGEKSVVGRLATMVDPSSSRSLGFVRALVTLYEKKSLSEQKPPALFEEQLVTKLEQLVERGKVHRIRVLSAYLLLMMGNALCRSHIEAINPRRDNYWFKSETMMLDVLRQTIAQLPPLILQTGNNFKIYEDGPITLPGWIHYDEPIHDRSIHL